MLCAPKADVTIEAKKNISSRPLPVKTAIQLQRHEEGFWKKKKNRTKKKKDFTKSSPRVSRQNKFASASFGGLSTWANEAALKNDCVIVTFSFNNRSPKDAAWKAERCLYT